VVVVAAVLLPAISRAQEASLKEIALPAPIGEHAIGVTT
jgi:hypothetical protein